MRIVGIIAILWAVALGTWQIHEGIMDRRFRIAMENNDLQGMTKAYCSHWFPSDSKICK